MSRPRPLTKTQRELLLRGRGGCLLSEISPDERRVLKSATRSFWIVAEWRNGQTSFRTTKHGEAKLVELAPPPPPGRLACVNPRCWRTFSKEKNPHTSEIVCGTCWRSVPEIRRERKELDALWRKTERARRRRGDEQTNETLRLINAKISRNWNRMIEFFTAPEKPEGLDTFLEEMGWKDGAKHEEPNFEDAAAEGAETDDA